LIVRKAEVKGFSLPGEELSLLAERQGMLFDIDPKLLLAMIQVESSGRPYASRYEPGTIRYIRDAYQYARAAGVTAETENVGQQTSWGLMQVMGFTARELGFAGNLPELCIPANGVEYGCRYLKRLQDRFGKPGTLGFDERVVVSYNAGSPRKTADGKFVNEGYLKKVWSAYQAARTH
jgi:soluble lytic murein transglycosylase-like protein